MIRLGLKCEGAVIPQNDLGVGILKFLIPEIKMSGLITNILNEFFVQVIYEWVY